MSDVIGTNADGTIDRVTLLSQLAEARMAYHKLMMGGQAVTLAYDMGAGKKQVTYTPADRGALSAYITHLETRLCIGGGRRAIGIRFR